MEKKPYLLLIESAGLLLNHLKDEQEQYQLLQANHYNDVLSKIRRFEPPVIIFDLQWRGCENNLALLSEIASLVPTTKIIVLINPQEVKLLLQAREQGAYSYCFKPIQPLQLSLMIKQAYELHTLENNAKANNSLDNHSFILDEVATNHLGMQKVCQMVKKVAPNDISVLLLGESGTGKELLARALHQHNARQLGPFIAINCAAIPETLLESELFGYEKGAFTGAVKQTLGKIEMAHGGTLFLDEIGDLPPSLQPKLLRFLQTRTIERLGGRTSIKVDVRIVCATHQPLTQLISSGRFRQDLYYRLSEISISIPPLRERGVDSLLIAKMLLIKLTQLHKKKIKKFTPNALAAIERYHWPGNVRELENKIKRAIIVSESHQIEIEDLDLPLPFAKTIPLNLKQIREEAERGAILQRLNDCAWNISRTAERLGISRPTLYNLMEKLRIYLREEAEA